MLWNDVVRSWWPRTELELLVKAWDSLITYARRGILGLGLREAPLLLVASTFPVIVSTLFLAAYAAVGVLVYLAGSAAARSCGWPWWVPSRQSPSRARLIPLGWLTVYCGVDGTRHASCARPPRGPRRRRAAARHREAAGAGGPRG